jgi:multidrug resistance efflux pump
MKKFFQIAATLSLLVVFVATASAQMTRKMTVTVPFDFYVGKTALKAGTYTIYGTSSTTGNGFQITDVHGHLKAVFDGQQVQSAKAGQIAKIEFRNYNGTYFLGRVWTVGTDIGRELQESRVERDAAKKAEGVARTESRPEFVTVTGQ